MIEILLLIAKHATKHRATATRGVWKVHTCAHCAGRYRHWMERKTTGRGASPEAAREVAERRVRSALETEFEQRPCPTCGLYQPGMVAFRCLRPHTIVFVALSLALLVAGAALVFSA